MVSNHTHKVTRLRNNTVHRTMEKLKANKGRDGVLRSRAIGNMLKTTSVQQEELTIALASYGEAT